MPHEEGEAGTSDAAAGGRASDAGETTAPETGDPQHPSATDGGEAPSITTTTTRARDGGPSGDGSTEGSSSTTAGGGGDGGDSGGGGD